MPGRFSDSKDSPEPKFPPNFFSRPSHHRSNFFSKVPFGSFLKTYDMFRFFDMSRVSFGKTHFLYICSRVECSSKLELSQWKILLVNQIFHAFPQGWNTFLKSKILLVNYIKFVKNYLISPKPQKETVFFRVVNLAAYFLKPFLKFFR